MDSVFFDDFKNAVISKIFEMNMLELFQIL